MTFAFRANRRRAAGTDAYLAKPIDAGTLAETVERLARPMQVE